MTVSVIGAGLIGGSIALDLQAAGTTVLVVDIDEDTRSAAARVGLEPCGLDEAVDRADLVMVATPAGQVGQVVARVAARRDVPVTDVASVSHPTALGLDLRDLPASWVGGHPMAGTERSGFGAARRGLLVGAPWLLTPHDDSSIPALRQVLEVVLALQARPIVVTADDHDQLVAMISHVPHLLAFAMQQTARELGGDVVQALAGPSFRDATRVAASDPEFWADLLTRNHVAVRAAIDRLEAWLDDSMAPGVQAPDLAQRLSAARRRPGPRSPDSATPEVVTLDGSGALGQLRAAGRQGRDVTGVATVAGRVRVHVAPPTHR